MASIDIDKLSPEERLELIDKLWDSLDQEKRAAKLTKAQREELDRRLDELDEQGPSGIPWEEVQRKILENAG